MQFFSQFKNALTGDIETTKLKAIFDDLNRPSDDAASSDSLSSGESGESLLNKSTISVDSSRSLPSIKSLPGPTAEGEKNVVDNVDKSKIMANDALKEVNNCNKDNTAKCPIKQESGSSNANMYLVFAAGMLLVGFIVYRCLH